jgi:lipoprotein-releasing system permease protein
MPFELQIALRYLTARRKQAFISLISGVSVLGVLVGVMALMIALGLLTGLQSEIRSKILGATAHVSIFKSRSGEGMDDHQAVIARVRALPEVLGAAPAVYGKALLSSPAGAAPVTMKGVLPAEEQTVTELGRQVEGASIEALDGGTPDLPPVLLGRDLANHLAVGPGDVVTVTSPQGRLSPLGLLPRVSRLRVAGLVRTGLYEFDSGWAYLPIATAQRLFGSEERVTLVEVRVRDMYAVREAGRRILDALGEGYVVTDWIETNESLFSALWLEKVAIGITIGLIVMVAALNIVATLVLMVMEKHKDIAILVSMGASRGAITRIFMLQGTLIGAVGTAVGASLGWVTCRLLDHYKVIQVPVDVYQVSYVPFTLLGQDALAIVGGSILTCFLATLYPARRASRLDPAEALRYE